MSGSACRVSFALQLVSRPPPHACHTSTLPPPHAQTSGTSGTTSATSCRPGSRSTSRTRTSTCPQTCCCALPASSCGPWHSLTTVPQWGAACSARRRSTHWTVRGRRRTPWKRSLGFEWLSKLRASVPLCSHHLLPPTLDHPCPPHSDCSCTCVYPFLTLCNLCCPVTAALLFSHLLSPLCSPLGSPCILFCASISPASVFTPSPRCNSGAEVKSGGGCKQERTATGCARRQSRLEPEQAQAAYARVLAYRE